MTRSWQSRNPFTIETLQMDPTFRRDCEVLGSTCRRPARSERHRAGHDGAVQHAAVRCHLVIGERPVQQHAVVPHDQIAVPPMMSVDELRLLSRAPAVRTTAPRPRPPACRGCARRGCRYRASSRRFRDGCGPAGDRPAGARASRSPTAAAPRPGGGSRPSYGQRAARRSAASSHRKARRRPSPCWRTGCRRPRGGSSLACSNVISDGTAW